MRYSFVEKLGLFVERFTSFVENFSSFLILFVVIIAFMFSGIEVSAYHGVDTDQGFECMGMYGGFDAKNWPEGKKVTVSCAGPKPGKTACQGSSAEIGPGETFDFGNCNCYTSECLKVEGVPEGCTVKELRPQCGRNGNMVDAGFMIDCEDKSGGEEPPGGENPGDGDDDDDDGGTGGPNRCECNYEEACYKDGKEGTRTCNGVNTSNGCGFGGDACSADCSACRVEGGDDDEGEDGDDNNPDESPGPQESPGPDESPGPEESPGPDDSPNPSSSPRSSQRPSSSPRSSVRPTPTPIAFNPAMCKCDGLDTSLIVPGLTAKITAKSYVAGADTRAAEIRGVTFTLVEGSGTVGTVIERSSQIGATVVSSSANRVNYASTWEVPIPATLKPGSIYRVFATTNCQRKRIAALDDYFATTAVLGEQTENEQKDTSIFAGISDFFQSIFGIRPKQTPTPAPTPTTSNGQTTTNPASPLTPSNGNEELKLRTFQPATMIEKSCTYLKFQVK
jgi:hypothetical protein